MPSEGGARVRASSCSSGVRGRQASMVKKRLDAFQDLLKLNVEACKLQRQLHQTLLRTPMLVPAASKQQRARVFEVVAEFLHCSVTMLRNTSMDTFEVLVWLPGQGKQRSALRSVGTGTLQLAALIDLKGVKAVLHDEFLPALVQARSAENDNFSFIVSKAVESLEAWVFARHPG